MKYRKKRPKDIGAHRGPGPEKMHENAMSGLTTCLSAGICATWLNDPTNVQRHCAVKPKIASGDCSDVALPNSLSKASFKSFRSAFSGPSTKRLLSTSAQTGLSRLGLKAKTSNEIYRLGALSCWEVLQLNRPTSCSTCFGSHLAYH